MRQTIKVYQTKKGGWAKESFNQGTRGHARRRRRVWSKNKDLGRQAKHTAWQRGSVSMCVSPRGMYMYPAFAPPWTFSLILWLLSSSWLLNFWWRRKKWENRGFVCTYKVKKILGAESFAGKYFDLNYRTLRFLILEIRNIGIGEVLLMIIEGRKMISVSVCENRS